MLVKVALIVLFVTSLLSSGMDEQQTIAEPASGRRENPVEVSHEKQVKTISATEEHNSAWGDDFTPITFVSFR